MKVLIVANYNNDRYSPWLLEQVEALKALGVEFDFYGVRGKGVRGYLANLRELRAKIAAYGPDLIHAHYGLSGLLANLQRRVPVVTTYHGSDIHTSRYIRFYSQLSIVLSRHNIFVADALRRQASMPCRHYSIIPCGIDTRCFYVTSYQEARAALGWSSDECRILFAGAFDIEVKNAPLAQQAVESLRRRYADTCHDAELIELKGFTRAEMAQRLNAADCLLMTSHREGSPQIVKEALACGCPIVSVVVGDVAHLIDGVEGCTLADRNADALADALHATLQRHQRTNGPQRIKELQLDNDTVAQKILEIYERIAKKKKR